jgi:hypothetical protein
MCMMRGLRLFELQGFERRQSYKNAILYALRESLPVVN